MSAGNKNTESLNVTSVCDCKYSNILSLLKKYQLSLKVLNRNKNIPGSYWGDSEAGIIENTLYVRADTPIHSLLHEACHYICMDQKRRNNLDTNAEGDYDEENAVCYLQILLANDLPEMDSTQMMQDMDSWGYSFRLGSAKAWFDNDAEDARLWLKEYQLIDDNNQPNYRLRTS
jgi:hypothetical protein